MFVVRILDLWAHCSRDVLALVLLGDRVKHGAAVMVAKEVTVM